MGRSSAKGRKPTASRPAAASAGSDERTLALQDFAKGFFGYLGCEVRAEPGRMRVQLSEKAKTTLGLAEDDIVLRFSQKDVAEDSEPAVPFILGGKLFETAVRKMRQDGFYTEVDIPAQHGRRDLGDLIQKWSPKVVWADIEPLEVQPDQVRYYLFNFRVTFRSDARKDVIHTIVTDGAGRSFPDLAPTFMQMIGSRTATPHPVEQGDGGMHGIRAAAYRAEKDITFWADRQGMELEEEVMPRLHKVVGDLTRHYQARIDEGLDKTDGATADEIRGELQQKISEEVLKHSLVVSIDLVNFATVHGPAMRFGFRLRRGDAVTQLRNWHDLTRDAVNEAYCGICADREPEKVTEARAFTVCDGGHLACERCTVQCSDTKCTRTLCVKHGGMRCVACKTPHPVCGLHGVHCDCGKELCMRNTAACDLCRSARCPDCITPCADKACSKRLCPADSTSCYVCQSAKCRSHLVACKYMHFVCGSHVKNVGGEAVCSSCVADPPKVRTSLGKVAISGDDERSLEDIADDIVPSAS